MRTGVLAALQRRLLGSAARQARIPAYNPPQMARVP